MADNKKIRFYPGSDAGRILRKWHASLSDNRGDRAALRKCATPANVVFVPAYHALFHDIADLRKAADQAGETTGGWQSPERLLLDRLPVIAGLVALVDADERRASKEESATNSGETRDDQPMTKRNLPKQMGTERSSGGGPVVSDLRFRRLLKCQTPEDLYPMLRKVIRLLSNRADVYSLANDVLYWGEEVRKQWAYDYYATVPQESK